MSLPLPDADAWGAPPSFPPPSASASASASGFPITAAASASADDAATLSTALDKAASIASLLSARDGLRGLLLRLAQVGDEVDAGKRENEVLGTYIDNLTRNSVVAAGQQQKR
ncbi:hypothetical protein Q5752_005910 [Cryptotrichosporon argae]